MELRGDLVPTDGRRSRRYAEAIIAVVGAESSPITAQQIHARLAQQSIRPGLATVYRALHALDAAGLLHAIESGGEAAYRRCITAAHDHLVCEQCGAVEEVPRSRSAVWFEAARSRTFRPPPHPAQLTGLCGDCVA